MSTNGIDEHFWTMADQLLASTELVIERPKGSVHPRFSDLIYPLDYGYLAGTRSNDGGGIDVWRGNLTEPRITGVVMTVDLGKGDAELKFLVGCTTEDAQTILAVHNSQQSAGILVSRNRSTLAAPFRPREPVRASARALIRRESKLLCLVYNDPRGVNYQMPGGGVQPRESLAAAVERELHEELGLKVIVQRLAAVCESSWPDPKAPDSVFSKRWNGMHRLDFVFICDLIEDPIEAHHGKLPDPDQTGSAWLTPHELGGVDFYPRSLLGHLDDLGSGVQFIREN